MWSILLITLDMSECAFVLLGMFWRNLCSGSAWTSSCRVGGTTEQAKRKLLDMLHWTEPSSRYDDTHTDLLILVSYSFISAFDWVPPKPRGNNLSENRFEICLQEAPLGEWGNKTGKSKKLQGTVVSRIWYTATGNQSIGISACNRPSSSCKDKEAGRLILWLPHVIGWGPLLGRH